MHLPNSTQASICPSCGYCSHCGRGGHQTIQPYYPPYPTTYPTWVGGTQTISNTCNCGPNEACSNCNKPVLDR